MGAMPEGAPVPLPYEEAPVYDSSARPTRGIGGFGRPWGAGERASGWERIIMTMFLICYIQAGNHYHRVSRFVSAGEASADTQGCMTGSDLSDGENAVPGDRFPGRGCDM